LPTFGRPMMATVNIIRGTVAWEKGTGNFFSKQAKMKFVKWWKK